MLAPEVSDFRLERPRTSVTSYKRDDKLPLKLVSPFTDIAHIVSSKLYTYLAKQRKSMAIAQAKTKICIEP